MAGLASLHLVGEPGLGTSRPAVEPSRNCTSTACLPRLNPLHPSGLNPALKPLRGSVSSSVSRASNLAEGPSALGPTERERQALQRAGSGRRGDSPKYAPHPPLPLLLFTAPGRGASERERPPEKSHRKLRKVEAVSALLLDKGPADFESGMETARGLVARRLYGK